MGKNDNLYKSGIGSDDRLGNSHGHTKGASREAAVDSDGTCLAQESTLIKASFWKHLLEVLLPLIMLQLHVYYG